MLDTAIRSAFGCVEYCVVLLCMILIERVRLSEDRRSLAQLSHAVLLEKMLRDLSSNLPVPALYCAPGSAGSRCARAGYELLCYCEHIPYVHRINCSTKSRLPLVGSPI